MSGYKAAALQSGVLKLIFQALGIANIADNTATAPLTNLYVSLHTADPTAAGAQNTSEIAYTGYARVAVARSSAGFTVSGASPTQVAPAATIAFPAGTGGSGTAAFFAIGTAATGAGSLLYAGPITPTIVCGAGIVPQLSTASVITED